MKNKNVCIVGRGSIGSRQGKILEDLGYKVYFLRRKKSKNFNNEISSYKHISSYNFNFYFICNPSSLHISAVKKIYKFEQNRYIKFFIEKPIATNLKDFSYLNKLIKKKKIFIYSGYMLRHDPRITSILKIVKNYCSQVRYSIFNLQTYMPSWHPWERYSSSYASQKKYGGGVLFTCCHEIDVAILLFGKVREVFCTITKSKLNTDVENSVFLTLKHEKNIVSNINLDFASQAINKRSFEIIFDKYLIKWNFYKNNIVKYSNNYNKIFNLKKKSSIEKIYKYQIKSFLNTCNDHRIVSKNFYKNFFEAEKVILAAKKSILKKKFIKI